MQRPKARGRLGPGVVWLEERGMARSDFKRKAEARHEKPF